MERKILCEYEGLVVSVWPSKGGIDVHLPGKESVGINVHVSTDGSKGLTVRFDSHDYKMTIEGNGFQETLVKILGS